MNRFKSIAAAAALLLILLVATAPAQMNKKGEDQKNQPAQSDYDNHMMGMMTNMTNHWQMMSGQMDKLQEHFSKMMQMNNMSELKKEMQKHQEMMTSIRNNMSEQNQLCDHMMSMMGYGGMHGGMMGHGGMHGGMMGHDHQESQNEQGDSHDH